MFGSGIGYCSEPGSKGASGEMLDSGIGHPTEVGSEVRKHQEGDFQFVVHGSIRRNEEVGDRSG